MTHRPGRQPLFLNPGTDHDQAVDDALGHEKVAGARLSSDARLWEQEITKQVASELPYLPTDDMRLHFDRFDAVKGAAVGAAIFETSGVHLPFIIRKDRASDGPELLPMDVFEHEGVLHPLTANSIKQAVMSRAIGDPMTTAQNQRVRGQNPYVGDVTGDTSPLEFGGNTAAASMKTAATLKDLPDEAKGAIVAAIAGGSYRSMRDLETGNREAARSGKKLTAGDKAKLIAKGVGAGGVQGAVTGAAATHMAKRMGLESQYLRHATKKASVPMSLFLIKVADTLHPNDLENFRRLMINNPMLMQTGNLGSLQLLLKHKGGGVAEDRVRKMPNIMVVRRDPLTEEITVKFPGGPAQVVRTKDELKSILGDKIADALSALQRHGVYVATENIAQASWAPRAVGQASVRAAEHDGLYAIQGEHGRLLTAYVVKSIVRPSGQVYPGKMAVGLGGEYGFAPQIFGVRIGSKNRLPASDPKKGALGVFVHYVDGTPVATTPLTITGVTTLSSTTSDADKRSVIVNAKDAVTGEQISLVPSRAVQGFVHVRDMGAHNQMLSQTRGEIYYMPEGAEWVELKTPVKLPQGVDELEKVGAAAFGIRDQDVHVHVDHAGTWSVGTPNGQGLTHLNDDDAFELLAGMGMTKSADLMDVRASAQCADGVWLSGLHAPQGHGELADDDVADVVTATDAECRAAALCPRVDASLIKAAMETGDRESVDAMLSLNFLRPENMKMYLEQAEEFSRMGTKLAHLLLATRLGMKHVREQSVKEAMDGIARTCDQLRLLKSAHGHEREQAHGDA